MSILEFIVSLIDSAAWPIVVITIVLIFRSEIAQLFSRFQSIRHKDTELLFREIVPQAENEAAVAGLKAGVSEAISGDQEGTKLITFAKDHPVAFIMNAWNEVEESVQEIRKSKSDESMPKNDFEFMQKLRREGTLAPSIHKLFKYLQRLRNEAIHTRDPDAVTFGEAVKFRQLSTALAKELHRIAKK